MQLRVLYLMLFVGLALASPAQQLSKRVPEVDYLSGQFSVAPSSQPFVTLDGGITFFFQYDGNFVVYQGSSPIASNALWASNTPHYSCSSSNTCQLIFQGDGNLVIYVGGTAVWSTSTNVHGGRSISFVNYNPYIFINSAEHDTVWPQGYANQPDPGPGSPGAPPGENPCNEVTCSPE